MLGFSAATLSRITSCSTFQVVVPDSSVLSTLFLTQIRLSRIPDIPAAYVRNSIQLLWARKISPFPSLYPWAPFPTYLPVLIWSAPGEDEQTDTAPVPVAITFTSRLLFAFSLFFF